MEKNVINFSDAASEEMVISALLNAKREDIDYIFGELKTHDFYFEGYQRLFTLLQGIYAQQQDLSLVSVMKLYSSQLEQIQLRRPIIEINMLYVNAVLGIDYGENDKRDMLKSSIAAIKKKAAYRDIANLITLMETDMQNDADPEAVYQRIEQASMEREPLSAKRSYLSPKDMGELMISTVLERMDKDKRQKEVAFTSFRQLNKKTGGFEKGDLVILSAASGVGKSALAMNITRDVAYVGQKVALYINSEMSDSQQALRFSSMLTQYSYTELRNGLSAEWCDKEIGDVTTKAQEYAQKKIHILTIPDLQISNIVSEVHRMVNQYGVEFVVVDYIGRMDTMTLKDKAEWQVMEQSARTLKTMAQELNIVVLMVAQMSSNGETLAKGSSMKNEADLWLNIRRLDKDERREIYGVGEEANLWNVLLEIRKARNAETGTSIPMHFHGDMLSYTDNPEKAKEYLALEQQEPYTGL